MTNIERNFPTLDEIHERLDDLEHRISDYENGDSRDYIYSGVRTIRHLVFKAQREILDFKSEDES